MGIACGRPAALHAPAMTRFDRFWEPFAFLLAAAIVWFGTL
jgi:hypothetical protein